MQIIKDSTDITTYFVLRDSTNHAPKTDVTITDIDLYYISFRSAISAKADATALAAADSTHADNKAYNVGQGVYRIDWPDVWSGAVGTTVQLIVVCSGVDTAYLEVEIVDPPQTGDSYAIVNSGTYGNSALKTLMDTTGIKVASIANNAITAAAINADAITAAKIADGAITNAKVADDVDVNVKTITNGAITAAAIADAAIDNATFAADVGSTAYATNIIALAAKKAVDEYDPPTKAELDTAQGAVVVSAAGIDAIFDRASSLTLSFEALITRIYQILNNAMTVNESTGAVSLKAIGGASEIAAGDVDSAAGVTDRDELTWA